MTCQAFSRRRAVFGVLFLGLALAACEAPGAPEETSAGMVRRPQLSEAPAAPNVVTDWAGIVPSAVNNPAFPRPPASG